MEQVFTVSLLDGGPKQNGVRSPYIRPGFENTNTIYGGRNAASLPQFLPAEIPAASDRTGEPQPRTYIG